MEGRGGTRERLLYCALVPVIVVAVMVLGGIALRTTLQLEKARQQTVFDATWSLAEDRVDRLDKLIIAQDNVVAAHVDLAELGGISRRWLATAGRETPTVRSILVLDMDHAEHDVLAFASRAAPGGRGGADDDAFRRTLVTRLVPQMNFTGNVEELRHLHVRPRSEIPAELWQSASSRAAVPGGRLARRAQPGAELRACIATSIAAQPHERHRRGGAPGLRRAHQGRRVHRGASLPDHAIHWRLQLA